MSPRGLAGGGGPAPPWTQSTPQCRGPSRLPEHPPPSTTRPGHSDAGDGQQQGRSSTRTTVTDSSHQPVQLQSRS
ncbi:hypothetical protein CapIbe_006019 [Capra ibex]